MAQYNLCVIIVWVVLIRGVYGVNLKKKKSGATIVTGNICLSALLIGRYNYRNRRYKFYVFTKL